MRRVTGITGTVLLLVLGGCALRDVKPGPADQSGLATARFVLSCPVETGFLDAPDYLMIYDWYKDSADPECRANSIMVKKGYSLLDVTEQGARHRRAFMYYNRDQGDYVWDLGMPKAELDDQRRKAGQVSLHRVAGSADDHVGVVHSAYRPVMVYEWKVDRRTASGKIHSGAILFHGATDPARMIAGLPPALRRTLLTQAGVDFLADLVAAPRNNITSPRQLRQLAEAAADTGRYGDILTRMARLPKVAGMVRSAPPAEVATIPEPNLRATFAALRADRLADTVAVHEAVAGIEHLAPPVRTFVLAQLRQLPDFQLKPATIRTAADAAAWARTFGGSKEYRHVVRHWPSPPAIRPLPEQGDGRFAAEVAVNGIGTLAEIRCPAPEAGSITEEISRQLRLLGLSL